MQGWKNWLELCRKFLFPPRVSSSIKITALGGSGVGKTVFLTSWMYFNLERKELRHPNDQNIQEIHFFDDITRDYYEKNKKNIFEKRCPVEKTLESIDLRVRVFLEGISGCYDVCIRDTCGDFAREFGLAEEKLQPDILSTDGALLLLPAHLVSHGWGPNNGNALAAFEVLLEIACRAREAKFSRWGISQYPIALVITQKDRITSDQEADFYKHFEEKLKKVCRFINDAFPNKEDFWSNLLMDLQEHQQGKEQSTQNVKLFVCKACGNWDGNRPPSVETILPEHLDQLNAPIAFLLKRILTLRKKNLKKARLIWIAIVLWIIFLLLACGNH